MAVSTPLLILASRSLRRKELLAAAGYRFEVLPSEYVEECFICSRESPAEYVARLAYEKAREVVLRVRQLGRTFEKTPIVVGCDTVAECQGEVLGKPQDEGQARRMLEMLHGREHRVLSGLCLWPLTAETPKVQVAVTKLHMERLSPWQLSEYLASGLWEGKSGAFGYQDRHDWLRIIAGSESNIVGLPLELLTEMLQQ